MKWNVSSFAYLNITQFLGALNDNIYKLLIVFFFIQIDGIENSHRILASTGAVFVLPFLLFSISSGTLADKFSKRNIIVFTKVIELITIIGGVFAFYFESKIGSYCVLFMLAAQSALFGPSKYGIVPELVPQENISKANGLMTSLTFLAIIIGTFLASFLLDITGRHYILASLFCTLVAVIGLFSSFMIEKTPPAGSTKRVNLFFFYEIYSTIKLIRCEPSLLFAVMGSSIFLFFGSFVQLNMIPFAVESLHLTDVQGGYLFLITALGIGTGSVLAGKISGKFVELGLPSLGGLGVAICCYALDLFSNNLFACLPLIALLGMMGGIYQIPLDSYIQVSSPKKFRGQILATNNFFSFFGVLISSALIFLIAEVFHFKADKGFSIMGTIMLGVVALLSFQFFDYLTRLICSVLSRLHFNTVYHGLDNIPRTPAVYICTHSAWNDTLLILGAQRRRIRFFIEEEQDHTRWMKKLYRCLRVVIFPTLESLENNPSCLKKIQDCLRKGISICILTNNEDLNDEIEKLKTSYSFTEILDTTHYPLIPVLIEKGEKTKKRSPLLTRLLRKFRVPATISFGSMICGPFRPPQTDEADEDLAALPSPATA